MLKKCQTCKKEFKTWHSTVVNCSKKCGYKAMSKTKRAIEVRVVRTHCPKGFAYGSNDPTINGNKTHCKTCGRTRADGCEPRRERVLHTHCVNGHEYTPENTGLNHLEKPKVVKRYCRICARKSARGNMSRRRQRQRQAKAEATS